LRFGRPPIDDEPPPPPLEDGVAAGDAAVVSESCVIALAPRPPPPIRAAPLIPLAVNRRHEMSLFAMNLCPFARTFLCGHHGIFVLSTEDVSAISSIGKFRKSRADDRLYNHRCSHKTFG